MNFFELSKTKKKIIKIKQKEKLQFKQRCIESDISEEQAQLEVFTTL